jgi:ABC-type sugar transport system permease subunit
VSVGGMTAPLLGFWAQREGFAIVFTALWGVLLVATLQAFSLPAVGRLANVDPELDGSIEIDGAHGSSNFRRYGK